MMDTKEKTIRLWKAVQRSGVELFLEWLESTDYFVAPASVAYHSSEKGGLANHSLNVFKQLANKVKAYQLETVIPTESIVICGLGHDLCKANFYIRGLRNVKENNQWRSVEVWNVQDKFPFGHGEKSVCILQDFFKLTVEEKLAIRWHMGGFDPAIHFDYPSGHPYRGATATASGVLVHLLFIADYESVNLIEVSGAKGEETK